MSRHGECIQATRTEPALAWEAMWDALDACSYVIPREPALAHRTAGRAETPTLERFTATYRELSDIAITLHRDLPDGDPLHTLVRRALIDAQVAWTVILLDGLQTIAASAPRPDPSPPHADAPPPDAASPGAPSPGAPSPDAPPPRAPSPDAPSPDAPSPGAPPPDVPPRTAPEPPAPSAALVPFSPPVLALAARHSGLPDESAVGRYRRLQRESGGRRLPDQATLARLRRDRNPSLPDEAGLQRYLRKRRQRRELHSFSRG